MYGLSDTVVADICSVFQRFPNIEEVLIFGSRAKGSYSEGSDIDLAAIGHDLTFNQLMDINIQIEDLGLLERFFIKRRVDNIQEKPRICEAFLLSVEKFCREISFACVRQEYYDVLSFISAFLREFHGCVGCGSG